MDRPDTEQLTRSTGWLGIATTLALAVPVLVAQVSGEVDEYVNQPLGWWVAYLVYVAVLVADFREWPRPWSVREQQLALAVMTVTGLAAVALSPAYGFAVVLPIVTATAATFAIGFRPALALAAGQAVVIMLVYLTTPRVGAGEAILQGVAWAGFMGFAVFTVEVAAREGRARDRLAMLNDELGAANEQLARTNTELAEAQRQLAVQSRNEERLRISRDLHDLIGHQLTALTLQLEAAGHHGAGDATPNVDRARVIARDLLGNVRDVVGRLRDDAAATDLATAVQELGAGIDDLAVHVDIDAHLPPLGDQRREAVVRIVQESVTNTVRHAHADAIWIRLRHEADLVVVHVHDDGIGATDTTGGFGLVGMGERLADVGGTLRTWSPPGGGFHLEASVPLPAGVQS